MTDGEDGGVADAEAPGGSRRWLSWGTARWVLGVLVIGLFLVVGLLLLRFGWRTGADPAMLAVGGAFMFGWLALLAKLVLLD